MDGLNERLSSVDFGFGQPIRGVGLIPRNRWASSVGLGGPLPSEWVGLFDWYGWASSVGTGGPHGSEYAIRAFLASDQQRLSAQTTDLLPRAYRDFVRGRLPVDLQERIRERCPVDEDYERCDVDLGRFQPGPLLRDLQGNQEIASDLNLALQQLSVVLSDLDNLTERRDSLLVLLHRESGGG